VPPESATMRPSVCAPKVGLFHPGTQHAYMTALALQRAKMLAWFATSLYYRPGSLEDRALRLLPSRLRDAALRQFRRRRHDDLDDSLIVTRSRWEWQVLLAQRLLPDSSWPERLIRRRNRLFGPFVAGLAQRCPPSLLYGYDGASREAFEGVRERRIPCVLDQTIVAASWRRRLAEEEKARAPQVWCHDLDHTIPYDVEREQAEHALAHTVVCACEFSRASLVDQGVAPEDIVVVPYGVDSDLFRPAPRLSEPRFRLLFVGAIVPRKGVRHLLEAARRLHLPRGSVGLVGHLGVPREALAPYEDLCVHVPHVPRNELPALYRQGAVFAFPTLIEGFGLVLLEAAACGLPIVATTNCGAPELFGDARCGALVPPADLEALTETLGDLLSKPEEAREMGRQARLRAEHFTWQRYQQGLTSALTNRLAP
jgi:starch synthase